MSSISRDIARRVRDRRTALGWDRQTLERRARLAVGQVSRIESGTRGQNLSIDTVVALADALDVDVGWLVTGEGALNRRIERRTNR